MIVSAKVLLFIAYPRHIQSDQQTRGRGEGEIDLFTYHFNGQLDVVLTHATVVVLCLQRVRLERSCSSATRCRCRLDQQTHRRLHEPRSTTGEATLFGCLLLFFFAVTLLLFWQFPVAVFTFPRLSLAFVTVVFFVECNSLSTH